MRVRGTQPHDPAGIHVDTDTVYVRSDSVRIETDDFTGWEYEEKTYRKDDYIRMISEENRTLSERMTLQDATMEELMFGILPGLGGGGL